MITCTPAEESAILKEIPKLNILNKIILRKDALLSGNDAQASDIIKSQIEAQKAERENKQKILKRRIKLANEDIEEAQKLVGHINTVASELGQSEEFKEIGIQYQNTIDRTKESHRRLETQNITPYEQSYQVMALKYELLEVFFKPMCQLADLMNSEYASGLRLLLSLITKTQETSQALMSAATEIGSEVGGKKGSGGVFCI